MTPTTFNAAEYLLDRHVRDGHGDRLAVVCGSTSLSYAELADETRRVAAGFRAIGVRPEERVMLCMADGVELLTGILGAMYLGAVPVPVSTMVTGGELATVLADSRARVLCLSVEFADAARTALAMAPEVEHVVLDGDVDLDGMRWSELRTAEETGAPYATWPDSPALWLYTSGTTGKPKGAMHRHGSVRDVAELYGDGVLGVAPGDRCLSVPKLFFAYGLGNSAFFPLAAGATTILERARPTPQVIAALAAQARPTLFFGVPTFYSALLNSDVPDDSFTSVRQAVSAGEPLPPVLFSRFRERFGVEILDGLGSTEALHIFLSNRPGQVHPGSSGTPVSGYRVEIRDEYGAPVEEPGKAGDLFLSGPSVATGYWCRTETTRAVFQGEWLRTGDTYVRNEDGTYTCLGRSNDMLKAGGIWVSPAEVEERLLEHPDVAEVAVVAGRDTDGLDKPIACVVPVAGRTVDPAALVRWCREGLAAYKRPRAVVRMAELPKTATGKIRRNVLRELVAEELVVRQVSDVTPPAVLT
ncbi:MAG: benzoate-CoA ligase family protein [Actinophytocola sp.]|uniref:benzoate-CoA ligase family protein n=1 Tax=Actinophytocola sp. TaxID=1872138 RepID=UPI001324546B|nr:benzoate-CoA ligase family protein [Actinophytocola sp.]MPZ86262.1 benzoate-CoA ligase family protein [Actinophytocola sp.]